MKNILITSAGKRVVLVQIFQHTLQEMGLDAKVYTTDMRPSMAPAAVVSDGCFAVPRCTNDGFIETILNICKQKNIGVIIPTIDPELIVLSENRHRFKEIGVELMLSDSDFIHVCRDKRKTSDYFAQVGISTPKQLDKNNPIFPMFAKPYDGSLSTNIHVIKNQNALTQEILDDEKLLFMEYIDKNEYQEFTIDMYYGKDNRVKCIVPRERLEIRAGEVNKGITRKNYIVEFLKKHMGYLPGVRGCICVQLFYRKTDNDIKGIEINPRFGGGYPLSYYAKANYAADVIKEYLMGEELDYSENWLDNTLMLRYDQDVIIYEKRVVAFDLDDTLYKEVDFLKSAFREISISIKTDDTPDKVYDLMFDTWQTGGDPFGELISRYGLNHAKEDLLTIYRNHYPNISLDNLTLETLEKLKANGLTLCLITDGRCVAQRNKLLALGLDRFFDQSDIIISEEIGFDKNSVQPFELIANKYPDAKIYYVGDNPEKDFHWPNTLGWGTICVNDNGMNIHKQGSVSQQYTAKYHVDNIGEVLRILNINDGLSLDARSQSDKIGLIAVYGAGGLGREVAGCIRRINEAGKAQWNIVGFFDDNLPVGTTVSHYGKVLGGIDELNSYSEPLALAIAVGSPQARLQIRNRISNPNISFPNLISPSFRILDPETFKIGEGNIIRDNCSVTCDVAIGNFNVLNGSNVLGHDVEVGDFNVLMPGVRLSGEVRVGDTNLLGVGSVVLQRVKIGDNITLGAGSVLMTKPKDGLTYIGVPAKKFDYE